MKSILSVLGISLVFCACDNDYMLTDEELDVKLFVEVGNGALSRTITDIDGNVSFSENDRVGLFIEGYQNPFLWTYLNTNWNPEESVNWTNRSDDFEFFAYYPCSTAEGIARNSVPMPDLSVQSGDLSDIGSKDFLVGSCVSSYTDNNGVVSFSGDNSFKHVYSLLYLKIENNTQNETFGMSDCTFSGEGIVSPHIYSFDASSYGMQKAGTEDISTLNIDDLSSLSAITVLINPVTLDTPLKFTLRYNDGGSKYEASANIGTEFKGGNFYKMTLRIVDGKLVMTGNEVSDWNVIMLEDIVISGSSI